MTKIPILTVSNTKLKRITDKTGQARCRRNSKNIFSMRSQAPFNGSTSIKTR